MEKKLFNLSALSLVIMLFSSSIANAQLFSEDSKFLHVGLGFGSPYVFSGSKSTIPPIHASAEFAVSDKIGVGGLIGYTGSKEESSIATTTYSWNFSYLILGGRGSYHFDLGNDKTDAYVGAMLGYNVASAKFESTDSQLQSLIAEPTVGGFIFGGYLGGRYMFSEKIGGFAELGYNIAWFNLGLAVKL